MTVLSPQREAQIREDVSSMCDSHVVLDLLEELDRVRAELRLRERVVRELHDGINRIADESHGVRAERNCYASAVQFALAADGWTTPDELWQGLHTILATLPTREG